MQINANTTILPTNITSQDLKKGLESGKIQEVEGKTAETVANTTTNNLSKAGIEMLTKSSTETVHTAENAVRVTTSEGTQGLLKSLEQLVNLEKYKLPEASKELITAFIKSHTASSEIKDGLSLAIQSQKDLAKTLLNLSSGILTDLFSTEDLADTNANTQKQVLEKFAQRIESFLKQAELPAKAELPDIDLTKHPEQSSAKDATVTTLPKEQLPTLSENALSTTKEKLPTESGKTSLPAEQASKLGEEQQKNLKTALENLGQKTDSNKTLGTEKPAQILNESTLKLANEQNPKNPPKAMEAGSDEKASSLTSKNPEAILKGEVVLPSKSAETTIAKDKLFEATIGKNTTETKENFVAKESSAKELLMAKDAQTTGNLTNTRQAAADKYELLQPKLNNNSNLGQNNNGQTQTVTNLVKKLVLLEETLKQSNVLKNDTLEKFLTGKAVLSASEQNEIGSKLKEFLPRFLSPKEGQSVENLIKDIMSKNKLPNTEAGENAALTKLLENASKLNNIQKQVGNLTENIKEMASSLVKNLNVGSEQTNKSLQGSFVLLMNLAEDQPAKPVYVHLYHEREGKADNKQELQTQTWLKVSLDYEYSGLVTAIFHLWQGNVLDIKVNFPEVEAADCFNSFVPEIIENISSSKLQLNNITLAR